MLRRQDLAALTTTRRQNRTAATGRHTSTEAVRLRTLPDIGLVGPFHVSSFYACPFEGKARRLYGSTPSPSTHVGKAATHDAQDPFAHSAMWSSTRSAPFGDQYRPFVALFSTLTHPPPVRLAGAARQDQSTARRIRRLMGVSRRGFHSRVESGVWTHLLRAGVSCLRMAIARTGSPQCGKSCG